MCSGLRRYARGCSLAVRQPRLVYNPWQPGLARFPTKSPAAIHARPRGRKGRIAEVAALADGDTVVFDINKRRPDVELSDAEIK